MGKVLKWTMRGSGPRVDCTEFAGAKADMWHLRRHPELLAMRFRANVKRQARTNWRTRCAEGGLTAAEQAALAAVSTSPLGLPGKAACPW